MPIGIINTTNVTLQNLTDLVNITDPMELLINVNNQIYGGILTFIILWIFAVIIFLALQDRENQPLINAMSALAVTTILSFLYRAILITKDGIIQGMITDYQMWVFPILTALLATINIALKDR